MLNTTTPWVWMCVTWLSIVVSTNQTQTQILPSPSLTPTVRGRVSVQRLLGVFVRPLCAATEINPITAVQCTHDRCEPIWPPIGSYGSTCGH
eukprot:176044-Prorocentrum_minimum.AAC.4